ncbi:transcription termination factor Rho [Corynebacterium heidelbergense]|uniref:transcription termination factor Rho n=1 Tax=Corynebacterium heidelbergense TaxID=2055947 RepID=UPI0015EE7883
MFGNSERTFVSLSDILNRAQANGLASLKLPELRQIAAAQGLRGTSALRKGELISVIQSGGARGGQAGNSGDSSLSDATPPRATSAQSSAPQQDPESKHEAEDQRNNRENRVNRDEPNGRDGGGDSVDRNENGGDNRHADKGDTGTNNSGNNDGGNNDDSKRHDGSGREHRNRHHDGEGRRSRRNRRNRRNRNERNNRNDRNDRGGNNGGDRNNRRNRDDRDNRPDNDAEDNNPQSGGEQNLAQVAGILDVADANTAFIRTTGYHAGPTDVYVPVNTARKYGMRHGDAIVGAIKPRSNNNNQGNASGGRGRHRQKYTPIHSVESVNGLSPEQASQRPDFAKLTPLYPNQRLRLETDPKTLTTRVIDLIMPIGKGQRALIVSPPKAGKTTILQDIANAISTNNPECYLMVVLVDERPEEVTDMQRSVKGEVIASTFDRPPSEHTAVAELAVERAKRLVEQGKDVVLLLDSITRLGRAYNNSSPASGRILSGGVDSNALYPPKRFLGAARNIENGGSLTIIATAMVETGSAGDMVIFEEFKGTGNAELKLDRKISERRVFPAVDVNPSGTRKDELLLGPDEARIMHKLRRILSALDPQAAIDLLIKQLRKNKTNRDFMLQIASSAPLADEETD